MIYEPQIECVCDNCGIQETVTPAYRLIDYIDNSEYRTLGYYACDDEDVIVQLSGWTIEDDGKVFCNECS